MSHAFTFHDVNEAYHELQTLKHHFTVKENTRNGPAWVFDGPVIITHATPWRRVLFDPIRDANPFFHFMESIWMLAGSHAVKFPAKFAANLANYSDDGITLHGAYGYRWAAHFGRDQIADVVRILTEDKSSRRAVIGMWDPTADLVNRKDLPCNTHVYFRLHGDYLDMTVCNRSNDLVWGMLGANIVHMSYLQEYIASALNRLPGKYYQFTNNLHIYEGWERKYGPPVRWYPKNGLGKRIHWGPVNLDRDEALEFVHEGPREAHKSPVLQKNAAPMYAAWELHKVKDYAEAIRVASTIYDEDWQYACVKWLERRRDNVVETQES